MRKLVYIATILAVSTSCQRSFVPKASVNDSTVSYRKDSIVVKDTTIIVPSQAVSAATTIDSLQSLALWLSQRQVDTSIRFYNTPNAFTNSPKLEGTIKIDRNGHVQFKCKEDSLRIELFNVTKAFLELYVSKNKSETVYLPGPEKKVPFVPNWCWWILAYVAISIGWKIAKLFFTPGTSVLDIIKHWFSKWK